jgi:hypothetical protein
MADLPAIVILAAMYVAAAISWPNVPDRLPVHWGLSGEVNRYGGKLEGLLFVPSIATIAFFMTRLTSSGELASTAVIRLAVVIFMAAVYAAMLLIYRGHNFNMTRFTLSAIAILLVAMVVAFRFKSQRGAHP